MDLVRGMAELCRSNVFASLDNGGGSNAILLNEDLGGSRPGDLADRQLVQDDVASGGNHISHSTANSTLEIFEK